MEIGLSAVDPMEILPLCVIQVPMHDVEEIKCRSAMEDAELRDWDG
jgi:hypothetical protein